MFPPCAPVPIPNDASGGRPKASFSQAPTTSSTTADAGDEVALKDIWSQPVVRMSAQVAASSAPPTTNPKYRGPTFAVTAGSTAAAS